MVDRPVASSLRRYAAPVALLLVAAVSATGCTGETERADAAPPPPPSTSVPAAQAAGAAGPAAPSTGCDTTARAETGLSAETMTSGGVPREFRRYVPSGYESATPVPVVVDLHGLTMTSAMEAGLTGMETLADTEGFVVVTPQGLGAIPFWNFVSSGTATDDVAFLGELVDETAASLCIDTSRVYATGISNGGLMSSALGCRLPDKFAAVAPVSGLAFLDDCAGGRPVPIQVVYGTADDVLPYAGGLGTPVRALLGSSALDPGVVTPEQQSDEVGSINFKPVEESMADWASLAGCAPAPTEERISPEVVLRTWPGCDGGAEVALYLVEGGGHTWPGSPVLTGGDDPVTPIDPSGTNVGAAMGHTTDDISATELAWQFFERHQLQP